MAIIAKGALCSAVKSKYEAARSLAQRADFHSVSLRMVFWSMPGAPRWHDAKTRNSYNKQ